MITKEPTIKTNFINKKDYYNSAREGFKRLLRTQNANNLKILLPAYIGRTDKEGSGVFDPVLESRTPYKFYAVNENLSINMAHLKALLESDGDKYFALLVIHYYGFCQNDLAHIRALCNKHNLLMVEDCAHSLYGTIYKNRPLGEWGDFSLYSIHKILPVDDGGILKINNSEYTLNTTENLSKETFSVFCNADWDTINQVRRDNYMQYLQCGIQEVNNVKVLYKHLPGDTVPLNFPVIIENNKREAFYFKLIKYGVITVSLYYRLIDEIDPDQFPVSHQISNSILNFPVHQDTTQQDIQKIVDFMHKAMHDIQQN